MALQLGSAFTVEVPGDRPPAYPAVYESHAGLQGSPPKFGFSLDFDLLARLGPLAYCANVRTAEHKGVSTMMVRTSSMVRPRVKPYHHGWSRSHPWVHDDQDVDELVKLLGRLEALNLPRDRLFDGRPVRLVLEPVQVDPPRVARTRPFVLFGLKEVQVILYPNGSR